MTAAPFGDEPGDTRLHLSATTKVYRQKDGTRCLDMGETTAVELSGAGFPALQSYVLDRLAYPLPVPDKRMGDAQVPACFRSGSPDVMRAPSRPDCAKDVLAAHRRRREAEVRGPADRAS